MPVPVRPIAIDNPHFSFQARFGIDGRTLRIRREFVSRVPHQVCPAEMDAEIANDMRTVTGYVRTTYSFTGAPPAALGPAAQPQIVERARTVAAGHTVQLDFLYSINPDCTSVGFATVRLPSNPSMAGIITILRKTVGFTIFRKTIRGRRRSANTERDRMFVDARGLEPRTVSQGRD